MSRSSQRQAALRLCLVALVSLASLFVWVAILSFDSRDWPSTSAWPPADPPHNWCGSVGAWIAHYPMYYLGVGTYALAALLTLGALALARGTPLTDLWLRVIGLALMVTVVSSAAAIVVPPSTGFLVSGPGGVLGVAVSWLLQSKLETFFTLLLLAVGFMISLLLAADELFFGLSRGIGAVGRQSAPALARTGQALALAGAAVAGGFQNLSGRMNARGQAAPAGAAAAGRASDASRGASPAAEQFTQSAVPVADSPRTPAGAAGADDELDEEIDAEESGESLDEDELDDGPHVDLALAAGAGPIIRDRTPPRPATPRPAPVRAADPPGDYRLPPLELLGDPEPVDRRSIEILCREQAFTLEQTLNEFRLEVQVVAIETGPVITVFELKLAPGIKVSQIASLTNDMARALKAPAVRVVAPLPGKNTIGIEVPNLDKEKVRLKDLIVTSAARVDPQGIPLFLGKDASGQPLTTDLTRMPHLLIAGTTGSGKSVCVSSIIMSVLMTRTPQEVQLILIDPKVVELAMFRDIPHLMCPIVTEMSKAEAILDWAATKMDERYALFAEAGVKDIRSYNRLGEAALRERMEIASDEEMAAIPVHLPYIVLIIDELADLMMTSAKEVEFYLCRIAQKSRAVGIHLIVSTQRPQANVVTGLIKSNLPCRIAFRVASRLDSRIVLDQNGGEVLMGQGDMLFLPPGSSKLIRAQGTFVADDELRATVKHAREQGSPNYHPELVRIPRAGGASDGERDELFDEAVEIILESGRGSVSLLQRRLTVGYSRASRLIDQMYEAGIVGDYKGSQAREVIMSRDEWLALKAQRDSEEAAEVDEVT